MSDLRINSIDIYKMSTSALKKKITLLEFAIESGEFDEEQIDEAEELIEMLSDELEMRG